MASAFGVGFDSAVVGEGVTFVAWVEIFLHYWQIRLGLTQPSVQEALGVLFPAVKQLGCTATLSPLLVPEFKNEWSYNSSPLRTISCNVCNQLRK
jgi:hypothetical protein